MAAIPAFISGVLINFGSFDITFISFVCKYVETLMFPVDEKYSKQEKKRKAAITGPRMAWHVAGVFFCRLLPRQPY